MCADIEDRAGRRVQGAEQILAVETAQAPGQPSPVAPPTVWGNAEHRTVRRRNLAIAIDFLQLQPDARLISDRRVELVPGEFEPLCPGQSSGVFVNCHVSPTDPGRVLPRTL